MTADSMMILASYIISSSSLLLSLYILYKIGEQKNTSPRGKPGNAWDHYHDKAKEKAKPKGIWG
jgi:hypothetical protein